ncbi:MAG: phosphoribosylanthranilate isomerase [Alphaproteobacteria bacterium]|nr:phosphoribosylanthranilate isomerase [Alphaproteobacteria bacterium]
MNIRAKICGINDDTAMRTAIEAGAMFVGLVFYPPSPRSLEPDAAAKLTSLVPEGVTKVGLFVDPDDELIDRVLAAVPLEMIQLHGDESPDRCRYIRARTGLPVMKAIKVATAEDVAATQDYAGAVDWLMFDAKAPADMENALPGGNALTFDWTLLASGEWPVPWMLAGGLNPDNVTEAVRASGALVVDVSSGVESAPGRKDPARIREFLAEVAGLSSVSC